jgi:hypothetical protein
MAGYTRQDTANNIANGNVIDADDFDAEYNAIESAFNASTGHTHDGTAGEGAPITKVGPSQDVIVSATNVLPKTTNTLDVGSSGAQFKDGFFDGTLNTDILSVDESATIGTTLGVTGATTLSSTLDVAGATGIDGDFDVATDKFTVASATGNTAVAGTLGVTGAATMSSTLAVTGAITATGGVTGNVTGTLTGDVVGNANTASAWANSRTIELTGDVTGTVSGVDGGGDVTIATTVAANSVALGTDTTGNYVNDVTAGTGVTVTHTPAEGSSPTVAIGQAVGTTDSVTFNTVTANLTGNVTGNVTSTGANTMASLTTTGDVVVGGDLTVSGTTTTVNTETINLADNQIVLNSNEAGTPTQNGGIEIERGTSANKTLVWNETTDKWTVGSETFVAATFEGNLTGDVTGNADTATTLATARTISLTGDVSGSTSFDGSGNVSITATVADDSHNHTISNIDGLQTEIDTKAELAGSASQAFSASTLNATTVDLGDWTITESAGTLYFATGGTNKMKLDASGNLTVTGNVTAYGTV